MTYRLVAVFAVLLVIAALIVNTSCQSGNAQTPQQTSSTSTAFYFSGSNLGDLSTTPMSLIQPAPQVTQAGSYMFIGNVSIANITGTQSIATCLVELGSNGLLSSTAGADGTLQPANLTVTGAATLTSAPTAVSLICSANNDSNLSVTQASLSIFPVGTLQTGP